MGGNAKLILNVLVNDGSLSQKQLIQKTSLTRREVRYSLWKLKQAKVIAEAVSLDDLREKIYLVSK